jgi:hypothetical protein
MRLEALRPKPAIVGVVPAAGYATRLQPLAGSKELLQVRGRPVIDYLLTRLESLAVRPEYDAPRCRTSSITCTTPGRA